MGDILTEDEADLYDRQIRLWGLDSQKRLRASTVLLIGLKGLGAEFCKNIVLAGIKSITLLDSENSTAEDTLCQFLIPRDKIGKNRAESSLERAKALNPMVEMNVDTESVSQKADDFFKQFSVVVATDCNLDQLLRINQICHEANVKFFCADVFGMYGYMFADLQNHKYFEEKMTTKSTSKDVGNKKQKLSGIEMIKTNCEETLQYLSLQESLNVNEKITECSSRRISDLVSFFLLKILLRFRMEVGRNPQGSTRVEDLKKLQELKQTELKSIGVTEDKVPDEYLSCIFSQVSPVCAITGGELAKEVIKSLSQKGEPHDNFFFFNPIKNHGIVLNCKQ